MKKTCLKSSCNGAVNVTVLREFFIKWALQQIQRRSSKAQLHRGVRHVHDTVSFVVIATLIEHSHQHERIPGTFPPFALSSEYSQVATPVKRTSTNADNAFFSRYYITMQILDHVLFTFSRWDGTQLAFIHNEIMCQTKMKV
jgi:hypothetical protein